jgi:hypothetical protein
MGRRVMSFIQKCGHGWGHSSKNNLLQESAVEIYSILDTIATQRTAAKWCLSRLTNNSLGKIVVTQQSDAKYQDRASLLHFREVTMTGMA